MPSSYTAQFQHQRPHTHPEFYTTTAKSTYHIITPPNKNHQHPAPCNHCQTDNKNYTNSTTAKTSLYQQQQNAYIIDIMPPSIIAWVFTPSKHHFTALTWSHVGQSAATVCMLTADTRCRHKASDFHMSSCSPWSTICKTTCTASVSHNDHVGEKLFLARVTSL